MNDLRDKKLNAIVGFNTKRLLSLSLQSRTYLFGEINGFATFNPDQQCVVGDNVYDRTCSHISVLNQTITKAKGIVEKEGYTSQNPFCVVNGNPVHEEIPVGVQKYVAVRWRRLHERNNRLTLRKFLKRYVHSLYTGSGEI